MRIIYTLVAVLVAITLAPAAAGASEPAVQPSSLHESFAQVANGPAPDAIVGTGAPVVNFYGHDGAAPYVRDGYLSTLDPATAIGGSYRIAHLGEDVTTVGASFAFSPYAADGGVLCLSIQADNIAETSPAVPVSPLHFIISPTDWGLDVNTEAGTGVDGIASGTFATPLESDGETLHRVEVVLDRAAGKARITLPDGSVRTFANPAFGLAGEHVYVEPFKSPGGGPVAQQTDALVSEWWASAEPVNITEDAVIVPKPQLAEPTAPALIAELQTTPPAKTAPAAPAPHQAVAPASPRGIKAVRHGNRVKVSWRKVVAETYVVRCGSRKATTTRSRVKIRSTAARCSVRAQSEAGRSPWVKVAVKR